MEGQLVVEKQAQKRTKGRKKQWKTGGQTSQNADSVSRLSKGLQVAGGRPSRKYTQGMESIVQSTLREGQIKQREASKKEERSERKRFKNRKELLGFLMNAISVSSVS